MLKTLSVRSNRKREKRNDDGTNLHLFCLLHFEERDSQSGLHCEGRARGVPHHAALLARRAAGRDPDPRGQQPYRELRKMCILSGVDFFFPCTFKVNYTPMEGKENRKNESKRKKKKKKKTRIK